jgi:hypothetical protein
MSSYFPSTTSHGTLLGLRITCFALAIAAVIVCYLGDTDYVAIGLVKEPPKSLPEYHTDLTSFRRGVLLSGH